MKSMFCVSTAAVLAASAWAGAPVVRSDSVTISQDELTRRVTISYELQEEPAIVTVDVRTNGVSIGGANQWFFAGDVNKKVGVGQHTMTWRPDKAWPNHEIEGGVTAVVTAWATNTPPNYMVVSLVTANDVKYYTDADFIPGGVTNDFYKTDSMVFRKIPAANVTWRMGSPSTEHGRQNNGSETAHNVTLSKDYFMAIYPCTQRQFECITGLRTSYFCLESAYKCRPAEGMLRWHIRGNQDWYSEGHAVEPDSFFGRLRTLTGLGGFDLPTDAQWEFACRAGCGSAYYDGHELSAVRPDEIAVYDRPVVLKPDGSQEFLVDVDNGTPNVGTRKPNDWGLYDMSGGIWELCLDWYQVNILDCDPERGPASGADSFHVIRGGAYGSTPDYVRSALRLGHPDLTVTAFGVGFRAACSL